MFPDEYKQIVKNHVLNEREFVKAIFSGHQRGTIINWSKVVLRPVLIKNKLHIQFVYYDKDKSITQNFSGQEIVENLDCLLQLPFKSVHVANTSLEIQVSISKKGKVLVRRKKTQLTSTSTPELLHDKKKQYLLPIDKPNSFLQAIGIMNRAGKVKSDRQKKFKQINEFLKLLKQSGELDKFTKLPIEIVDYGCGNAYLSFAAYYYLNHIIHLPAHLTGVDLNAELIDKHRKTAEILGWQNIEFNVCSAANFKPLSSPDITLALHACDTATDEALAQGIQSGSKLIFSVPCCHQHIQKQINESTAIPEIFRPVLRYGIFKERLGDILTDTFRALLLRIMGYQTDVIQFISSEHTAKNIMIKAVYTNKRPSSQFITEYRRLKDYWKVTPYLEQLLGEKLQKNLATTD